MENKEIQELRVKGYFVQAAMELSKGEGLKSSSVRNFEERAGYSHASLYNYFKDIKDLISMIHPQHIIPAHGTIEQLTPMVEIAKELGYRTGKECHLMRDGHKLVL